jgi:hypothetical protein
MKSAIWIAYDLGVKGDYESLYSWLDARGAVECGDSLAFLRYEHRAGLAESLKRDLTAAVEFGRHGRVYLIHMERDTRKMKGTFLIGGRKAAPWTGFATTDTPSVDESTE